MKNQLAGISGSTPDCQPLTASFQYDALGRRIQKTVNGTTTTYLHDGLDVIAELGPNSATYLRTHNIDEALARYSDNGDRFLLADMLGSTIALTDHAGVAIATTYSYSPFGETEQGGQASDNATQYTGRENDGTGLYYYRARYYAPELARFVSADPIGLAGGWNEYSYVNNSPLNYTDPEGLTPWGLIFAGADLAWQLYQNDGNLRCVDWGSVGMSLIGGGLLNGLVKGAFKFKTVGSHTWDATSKWMNANKIQTLRSGQQRHHWLLEQNQGIGKNAPDWLKNQPWNTNPVSAPFNNWMGQHPGWTAGG